MSNDFLKELPNGAKVQTLDEVASWPMRDGWRLLIGRRGDGSWVGRAFTPDGSTAVRVVGATALKVYKILTLTTGPASRGRRCRLPKNLDGRMVRPARPNRSRSQTVAKGGVGHGGLPC